MLAMLVWALLFLASPKAEPAPPPIGPHVLQRTLHSRPPRPVLPHLGVRASRDRPPPALSRDVLVYVYWPGWSSPVENVPFEHISHLALFSVDLASDGSLDESYSVLDSAAAAVTLGHAAGVRVHITLTVFSESVMESVFPSASRRAACVSELAALVTSHGLDGVNVDTEGLDAPLKDDFTAFIRELKAGLPAGQDDLFLAMPSVDWSGAYDYDQLAASSDGLFIMGYAYYWTGGNPGPNAPLFGSDRWGRYSLEWTLQDYREYGAPDDRIIMGLPLYGQEWPTTNTTIPGTATGDGWSVVYSSALEQAARTGRNLDSESATAYTFPDGSHQLWYDDIETLRTKISWAVGEGLQGIGFWAVNYDEGDPDLWSMVDDETRSEKLPEDTSSEDTSSEPGVEEDSPDQDEPDDPPDRSGILPPSELKCRLGENCEAACGCGHSSEPHGILSLFSWAALLLSGVCRARARAIRS